MRRSPLSVAVLAGLAAAALASPGRAAPPATCGSAPGGAAFHRGIQGSFGEDLEGGHVLVPFDVPEGATRLEIRFCYDQPSSPTSSQIRHTLDLGLYSPTADGAYDGNEFRGWGGSSRPHVSITPERATRGYLPGAVQAGAWAAEIGVAAVAGPAEGDPDGSVGWRLEVYLGTDPADADQPWQPVPYPSAPRRTEPGWYAGDFHVHAEHSGNSDATMEETFGYAFGEAGLDFITLSDYVTTRHWDEMGALLPRYPDKLVVRSAEVITYRGHINNHASATYVDHRTGPVYVRAEDGTLSLLRGPQPASRVLGDIRAAGGFTQVNHPTIFPSEVPGFGNICRGCSWDYTDAETRWELVDAFEVQTGPAGTPEPQGHEIGPNPFTPLAIGEWDALRARGFRITAVGSSDSHHAGSPSQVTQSPIGEATTVVYANELSEAGIADAVRAGHAYVKFFSPAGPDLRFEAVALEAPGRGKGKGRPAGIMGDVLPVGSARFTARVLGVPPGSEPRTLFVFRDGAPLLAFPVVTESVEIAFDLEGAGDYRLQLQRGSAIEALSNPITLAPKERS